MTLHISDFGGGVALLGAADVQRTDELQACDSYDIGERGQLVVASDLSNFADALDGDAVPARMSRLYACTPSGDPLARALLVVGLGIDAVSGLGLCISRINLVTGIPTYQLMTTVLQANGYQVTFAAFPFVDRLGVQQRPLIFCPSAREGVLPHDGLPTVCLKDSGAATTLLICDWLGTGSGQVNEAVAGTKNKSIYPRGVAGYNGHLMLWGFDNKAVDGEGANRLMFSNTGNPTKIGNDPGPAGVDRDFLDTDAINIGAAGEIIRAGYSWAGKFWIGTNRELHYLAGYGRDSFITNGTVGIRKSRNVIGPHCMIEGPDGLLYGVSSEGLWGFDGSAVEPLYRRVVDFRGKSLGWWDLIWQDATRATTYPGRTNQDLVWMLCDPDAMQVWVVIPWCNAAAGYGYGTDTVIIKFHVQTGGFTRQVFTGKILPHGSLIKRESSLPTRRYILDSQIVTNNVKVYGAKADASVSPILPTALPDVTFGEYAPYGVDDDGVTRRVYLTVSWDAAASLPIVFLATPFTDQEQLGAVRVSIQVAAPGAPADGDLWLDTSNTDTNIGNSVAGAIVPAAGDYVLKRWIASWAKWVVVPTGGGQLGTRATIPIAFRAVPAMRFKIRLQTTSAAGRYQIEGLGLDPSGAK